MSRAWLSPRRARLALSACFLGTLLSGCFDGHLDSFEAASTRGGLLDDFEDRDNAVEPDGWWYATDDGTGPDARMTFDPITGRGESRFAAHLAGGPTEGFGAFLGLDLPGGLFDATGYASLSFWARLEPAGELSTRFQTPPGTQYEQVSNLDATWQELVLPFPEFLSRDDGTVLDPNGLTHLQLWVEGARPAFHLYVDDVRLIPAP